MANKLYKLIPSSLDVHGLHTALSLLLALRLMTCHIVLLY
jgi:hypothetical protein